MKAKEEELRNAMAKAQELVNKVKDLEEKTATLSQEKKDLTIQLQAVCGVLGVASVRPREGQRMSSSEKTSLHYSETPQPSLSLHCNVATDATTKKSPLNYLHTQPAGPISLGALPVKTISPGMVTWTDGGHSRGSREDGKNND